MRRIIFVNRYFYPDQSATSQILSDLAFYLAEAGHQVHVITSRQRYDEPATSLLPTEIVRGVQIDRVATTRFGRSALVGRGVDYLSFYATAWRALRQVTSPGDVIVAKTDPPLLSILGQHVAKRRQAHLVNWLQDLYPEIAIELGVTALKGPLGAAITYLRDRSLKAATVNVAIGELMVERIRQRGVSGESVRTIPNWTDDELVQPISPAHNDLRSQWGLQDKLVIAYSGNLGRVHEFETILSASELLRDRSDLVFLFIGGGHNFEQLARKVVERGVQHLYRFMPYQDRTTLAMSLSVGDIHWVSLLPNMEGLIVPSKLYGIAAAGRPTIAVTARDGEVARLMTNHKCGIVVEVGDGHELAKNIALLSQDPQRLAELGRNARAMIDSHFSRKLALARWDALLQTLHSSAP